MTAIEPNRPPTRIAKRKRGSETMADMVRSLGLIAVIIAVTLLFVPGLLHPSKSDRFPAADYSDYVSGFHQVTGKTALVPGTLPSGWEANAGALTGPAAAEHLHVGFAVPGTKYAGLEESVAPAATFVQTVLGKGAVTASGSVSIDGDSWQTRTSSVGEYALARTTANGITIIVTGSATDAQLTTLAGSLH